MRAWCWPRCPTPTTPARIFAGGAMSVLRLGAGVLAGDGACLPGRRGALPLLRPALGAVAHAPAELDEVAHLGRAVGAREELVEGVLPEDVRPEEEAVRLLQLRDRLGLDPAPLAADLVHHPDLGGDPLDGHVRRDIA